MAAGCAGPGAPPLVWDTERQYTRERLEVYYLSHSAKPVGEEQLTEARTAACRAAAAVFTSTVLLHLPVTAVLSRICMRFYMQWR